MIPQPTNGCNPQCFKLWSRPNTVRIYFNTDLRRYANTDQSQSPYLNNKGAEILSGFEQTWPGNVGYVYGPGWEPRDLGFIQKGEWQGKVRIEVDWEYVWDKGQKNKPNQGSKWTRSALIQKANEWQRGYHPIPTHTWCPKGTEPGQMPGLKDKSGIRGTRAS